MKPSCDESKQTWSSECRLHARLVYWSSLLLMTKVSNFDLIGMGNHMDLSVICGDE